ncbi:hypothetical protein [Nocardia sp. CA-120079]|uniref:hypothetical protein n=1 Tax=Nocardia sp. CA-120079 TaxID=3239974 RepID=UPI003D9943C6
MDTFTAMPIMESADQLALRARLQRYADPDDRWISPWQSVEAVRTAITPAFHDDRARRGLPTAEDVSATDVIAALQLLAAHREYVDIVESHLLAAARDRGVSLSELAAALGRGTRQGMNQYAQRVAQRATENASRAPIIRPTPTAAPPPRSAPRPQAPAMASDPPPSGARNSAPEPEPESAPPAARVQDTEAVATPGTPVPHALLIDGLPARARTASDPVREPDTSQPGEPLAPAPADEPQAPLYQAVPVAPVAAPDPLPPIVIETDDADEPDRDELARREADRLARTANPAWRMRQTAHKNLPQAPVTCPGCGHTATADAERGRLKQDIQVIWLEEDPEFEGGLVERRHCQRCRPDPALPVADVECMLCTAPDNAPFLLGRWAAELHATGTLPMLVRRWLTVRGHWHEVPEVGMVCPDHPEA